MKGGVIGNSMDGIVLRELQEQKCQQHVCQHTDVVKLTLAGWMVPIQQWKMVKFSGAVCFSDISTGCKHNTQISVKNCSSYYIYKLYQL